MSRTVGDVVAALGRGVWTLKLRSLALLVVLVVLLGGLWKVGEWGYARLESQASEAQWYVEYYRQKGSAKNVDWLATKLLSSTAGGAIEKECNNYAAAQRDLLGVWVFLTAAQFEIQQDAGRFICLVRAANQGGQLVPWERPNPWDRDFNRLSSPGYQRSYD